MEKQAFELLMKELTSLSKKGEKQADRLESLNLLLQKQGIVLEEHQKRSLSNEALILEVRKEAQDGLKTLREEIKKELEPLTVLLNWVLGTWKLLKWAGAFAAILTAISICAIKCVPGVNDWLHPRPQNPIVITK